MSVSRAIPSFEHSLPYSPLFLLDLSLGQLWVCGTAAKIPTSERRELPPLTDLGCVA
ncbi:MAG: hypothetical protein U0787_04165 [Polyangia bacterium]